MDFCTVIEFREALTQPHNGFETLHNVTADLSTLCCSHHFAECHGEVNGRQAIIYAPITPAAMHYVLGAERALSGIRLRAISPYHVYCVELRCGMLRERRCSIIVEYPFYGTPLSEAMYTMSHDRLTQGLEQFFQSLAECNISHNHLDERNIIVDNRYEWHCIRQYYSTSGLGGDTAAKERLQELIDRYALADGERLDELHEEYASYGDRNIIEQRQRITHDGLVGFADADGNTIVECKYLAASDFAEGRSVVTDTSYRMGLIDYMGHEVIPTLYDALTFDVKSGCSWAYKDGLWAKFNYSGECITEGLSQQEEDI